MECPACIRGRKPLEVRLEESDPRGHSSRAEDIRCIPLRHRERPRVDVHSAPWAQQRRVRKGRGSLGSRRAAESVLSADCFEGGARCTQRCLGRCICCCCCSCAGALSHPCTPGLAARALRSKCTPSPFLGPRFAEAGRLGRCLMLLWEPRPEALSSARLHPRLRPPVQRCSHGPRTSFYPHFEITFGRRATRSVQVCPHHDFSRRARDEKPVCHSYVHSSEAATKEMQLCQGKWRSTASKARELTSNFASKHGFLTHQETRSPHCSWCGHAGGARHRVRFSLRAARMCQLLVTRYTGSMSFMRAAPPTSGSPAPGQLAQRKALAAPHLSLENLLEFPGKVDGGFSQHPGRGAPGGARAHSPNLRRIAHPNEREVDTAAHGGWRSRASRSLLCPFPSRRCGADRTYLPAVGAGGTWRSPSRRCQERNDCTNHRVAQSLQGCAEREPSARRSDCDLHEREHPCWVGASGHSNQPDGMMNCSDLTDTSDDKQSHDHRPHRRSRWGAFQERERPSQPPRQAPQRRGPSTARPPPPPQPPPAIDTARCDFITIRRCRRGQQWSEEERQVPIERCSSDDRPEESRAPQRSPPPLPRPNQEAVPTRICQGAQPLRTASRGRSEPRYARHCSLESASQPSPSPFRRAASPSRHWRGSRSRHSVCKQLSRRCSQRGAGRPPEQAPKGLRHSAAAARACWSAELLGLASAAEVGVGARRRTLLRRAAPRAASWARHAVDLIDCCIY